MHVLGASASCSPALVALVAAGCGGASDSTERLRRSVEPGRRSSSRSSPTPSRRWASTRSSRCSSRRRRARASRFSQSYGASGDQSRKVEAGLKTDVVNFSARARRHAPRRRRASSTRRWKDDEFNGHRLVVRRDARRPQGQPEEHHATGTTCSSPASRWSRRTRSAPARRSGTCSRPTRSKSDGGKNPQAGLDYLTEAHQPRQGAAEVRAARRPSCSSRARATCCSRYENEAIFAERNGRGRRAPQPADDAS